MVTMSAQRRCRNRHHAFVQPQTSVNFATPKGTNTNLNLNDEFSHECTNVRVQIKRLGEKYELKFERRV